MRTTLDIDQIVLETARVLAASSQKSLGSIISELALKGLKAQVPGSPNKDYPTFRVPDDAHPLDPLVIRRLIEEDGLPD